MRWIQGLLSSSLSWYSSCFISVISAKNPKHIYHATVLNLWPLKAHLLLSIPAKRAGGIGKAFSHPEFSDASWLQTVIQLEDAQIQERNDISVEHVISDFPCRSWGSLLSETRSAPSDGLGRSDGERKDLTEQKYLFGGVFVFSFLCCLFVSKLASSCFWHVTQKQDKSENKKKLHF